MTQIDTDTDPVVNVAGLYLYEPRFAEGVVEYPPEHTRDYRDEEPQAVEVQVTAERNEYDHPVLRVYARHGCSVKQYFDDAYSLDQAFEEIVERHDLTEVDELAGPDEKLGVDSDA